MRSAPSTSYRDDIQGLRALAVLSVLLFHAWPGALPGGFVGVDIFLVISGFLISGILLRDLEAGRFSLADFYRKRVRRIFPALFVVLAATLAAGALILPPGAYAELSRNGLSTALFVSNIDFFLTTSYFGPAAEMRPLLHTWSLSVEEQFYIVFPLLLALGFRRARRWLLPLLAAAFLLSLAASVLGTKFRPNGAYFLSPFRAFELLIGVLAVSLPLSRRLQDGRLRLALGLAGLAMIAASLALFSEHTAFPGIAALLPTLGTGLILHVGRAGGSGVTRALSVEPFLFFGAISYSLYLWHWPVMAYLRILSPQEPAPAAMAAAVALSVGLAWLSYRFVERPAAGLPVAGLPVLKLGLAGTAVAALLSAGLWQAGGLPGRFSPQVLAHFDGAQDYSPERHRCHRGWNGTLPYAQTCLLGAGADPVRWAIWGDSHGTELAAALAETVPLRQITASACPPVIDVDFPQRRNCRAANAEILAALEADEGIEGVVLVMNRVSYRAGGRYPSGGELRRGYAAAAARLRAAGKRVLSVQQVPNIEFDAPRIVGLATAWGRGPDRIGRDAGEMRQEAAGWNAWLAGLGARHDLVLHDPAPALCRDDVCPAFLPGEGVLYFNATHVSMAGARRLAAGIAPLMADPADRRLAARTPPPPRILNAANGG